MKRALFIQHDQQNPAGLLAGCFARRGYDVTVFGVLPGGSFPDPAGFDAIVALGADWSVPDPAIASWAGPERDLLAVAVAARTPVLGICFGGQLLAEALGGVTGPAACHEIGWKLLQTPGGQSLIEPGPWMCWHADRWWQPLGASVLAYTAAGPHAFAAGSALGVQFHPEVTPAILRGWLDHGGAGEADRAGVGLATLIEQTARYESGSAIRAGRLVDAFIDGKHQRLMRAYATYGG